MGRVGSGQEVLEISFDRVGSGQEAFKYHGSGRVALTRSHPREGVQPVTKALVFDLFSLGSPKAVDRVRARRYATLRIL